MSTAPPIRQRKPVRRRESWQPEPLELPIGRPSERRESGDDDRGELGDLPGSHVVVIDLA